MSSLWVGLGTAAASLGAGLYSANKASDASSKAAKDAGQISAQSSAAQLAFLREQSNQARNDQLPFLSGGTGAFGEFLKQLGVTPAPVARTQQPGTSASGASLIPLPGISTSGLSGVQTSAGARGGLFFDRDRRMIVDEGGGLVSQLPEGAGELTGLFHGNNNKVRIDAQGNLVSVGSRGENPLNIRLTGISAEERAALNPTTGAPSATTTGTPEDRYGAYFASPGYKFLFDEAMRGARANGAARGSLYSGAMLKELQNRATGLASQDYGNYMQRLAEATRVGQAAASGTAANASALGTNGAMVMGNAASDQANARLISGSSQASSIIGANNAFQNALGSGLTALGDYYHSRGDTMVPPATRSPAVWNDSWSLGNGGGLH